MRRFFWDFYGGQSRGTASHFLAHLEEFFSRNGIDDCPMGVESHSMIHHATWCVVDEAVSEVVMTSLRPHRAETVAKVIAEEPDTATD